MVLYELANALSRRGHEVNFFHGPTWPTRIDDLSELPSECFAADVANRLVDSLDDPDLPEADVIFNMGAAPRLGLPATYVQGYKMLGPELEVSSYRAVGMKYCVASWLVDVGLTLGVDAEQLVHVPPGIDHELFRFDRPLEDREFDVAVLYHPFPEKRWAHAVEVLEELHRRRPEIRVVVFSVRVPPDLPDWVTHKKALGHRALADEVYGRTRVMMQASRHEGFGLTPLEAMACGAALATTDCGGPRDYGIDGETALVVPVDDVAALADAVERLLDDDALRHRLARAGERKTREFRWINLHGTTP